MIECVDFCIFGMFVGVCKNYFLNGFMNYIFYYIVSNLVFLLNFEWS